MEFFELNSTLKWTIEYLSLMVSRAKNIRRFENSVEKKKVSIKFKKSTNAKFKYFSGIKWCFIENSYFTRYHCFFFFVSFINYLAGRVCSCTALQSDDVVLQEGNLWHYKLCRQVNWKSRAFYSFWRLLSVWTIAKFKWYMYA